MRSALHSSRRSSSGASRAARWISQRFHSRGGPVMTGTGSGSGSGSGGGGAGGGGAARGGSERRLTTRRAGFRFGFAGSGGSGGGPLARIARALRSSTAGANSGSGSG